ncbi:signal transduction histidine kinase [Bifidobacterium pseudolongum subsp. globosum]|uniref:Signal transduction histidine kinase n=1 Tax=Bifidobacterium pseudolongum subsp. globosum TaxID=1690 RepID=A0A2N3QII8_9BIFI|nr:histidine kinase [Bifidobacterium pseudolongum]PKU91301.1 signal transduction histidine kinase [Bifidobacterium pseudolongum subsp. globosum]PKV05561.1 signal transduction histidine kinase [Bifidobacterium pseudolongum subsp. globosum]
MKQKLIDILGRIRHPYLFLVIAMFSCMMQFDIWNFGKANGAAIITALVIVQALAVTCYWFPVQAALAILVFNGIGEYAIAGYGLFTSYMMLMALLILSYKLGNRGAIAVYVAMICYTILEGVLLPEFMPAQTVTSFCAGYTLIAILGRFFRWNSERNRKYRQLLRTQSELRILRRDQMLAAHIHDTLSQKLSAISMIAQCQNTADGEDADAWRRIVEYSSAAQLDMRTLIRQLHDSGESEELQFDAFTRDLRAEIDEDEQYLRDNGFHGHTDVHIDEHAATTRILQTSSVALMVVHEIYTNIFKHADPAQPYEVSISIGADGIRMDAHNAIAAEGQVVDYGGSGLQSLTTVIRELGGTLVGSADGDQWHARAFIPLQEAE